ncbi:mediator of RNA polymerase II transcription subunit 22a-like isoform X2 [Primulina tabacum]|uniref:mediator of RNA polymerase II transcription subunit 22a-like isoform X2 n=1 Tax=Primulina tabacum TaxID=48773 RepID=UPI003F592234
MNNGVGIGGAAGGGGLTSAASAAAAQKQRVLLQRVDADVEHLVDNFEYLVNVTRVQAADSLLKLVSELKQTAIFSGFASLNDHVDQRTDEFNKLAENTNGMLARIGEEAAASLIELESQYYSSTLRSYVVQEM